MQLSDLQFAFDRALRHTCCIKRLSLTALSLTVCALIFIATASLGAAATPWIKIALIFLPFFLSTALLMPIAVLIIQLYRDAAKNIPISIQKTVTTSWESLLASSYFLLPLLLAYLALWLTLGIFLVLMIIPGIGAMLAALLAFAPFILNLCSLLLAFASIALLFLIPPLIALRRLNYLVICQEAFQRMKTAPFLNALLAVMALAPLALFTAMTYISITLTYSQAAAPAEYSAIYYFFIAIPTVVFLAPALLFFFHFSAEAYLLLIKLSRHKETAE